MNSKLIMALAFAVTCSAAHSVSADEVDLAQVMGHGQSCDHIIQLIMRHGVNNSVDQSQNSIVHHDRFGSYQIPDSEIGDLELSQVTALASEHGCGPKFAIMVRNKSTREVCGVRVTAVALLGRICSDSPTQIAKIERIGPGEAAEIHITLPADALSMGNHNGQVVGFRRLLVAIDSFDQFMESNEANNIKVFDLASIPAAIVSQTDVAAPASNAKAVDPASAIANTGSNVLTETTTVVDNGETVTDDVQSAINKLNMRQPVVETVDQTAAL